MPATYFLYALCTGFRDALTHPDLFWFPVIRQAW